MFPTTNAFFWVGHLIEEKNISGGCSKDEQASRGPRWVEVGWNRCEDWLVVLNQGAWNGTPKNFAGKILPWMVGKPGKARISGKMLRILKGIRLDVKIYTIFEFPFYTALLGLVNTMIPNELGHLKTHRKRQSHSSKKTIHGRVLLTEKMWQKWRAINKLETYHSPGKGKSSEPNLHDFGFVSRFFRRV